MERRRALGAGEAEDEAKARASEHRRERRRHVPPLRPHREQDEHNQRVAHQHDRPAVVDVVRLLRRLLRRLLCSLGLFGERPVEPIVRHVELRERAHARTARKGAREAVHEQ